MKIVFATEFDEMEYGYSSGSTTILHRITGRGVDFGILISAPDEWLADVFWEDRKPLKCNFGSHLPNTDQVTMVVYANCDNDYDLLSHFHDLLTGEVAGCPLRAVRVFPDYLELQYGGHNCVGLIRIRDFNQEIELTVAGEDGAKAVKVKKDSATGTMRLKLYNAHGGLMRLLDLRCDEQGRWLAKRWYPSRFDAVILHQLKRGTYYKDRKSLLYYQL